MRTSSRSTIKNRIYHNLLKCFNPHDYYKYQSQISFGHLPYDKIDNLHKFLNLFRPYVHCVLGDDKKMGYLLVYITLSALKENNNNEIFKLNIENHDPSLNISFTKNYRDVTEWVNSTNFKPLSKSGILKEIKRDLIKGNLICCLCITMNMEEILHNCFELLRYQ